MLRKCYIAAACLIACMGGVQAQENTCVIKGRMLKDSLRHTPQRIQKIYLTQMDEYERMINVDSVKPVNGTFTFTFSETGRAGITLFTDRLRQRQRATVCGAGYGGSAYSGCRFSRRRNGKGNTD